MMKTFVDEVKNESWSSRIAKLKGERKQVESTEQGFICKSYLKEFFISESVIPKECKVYDKGGVLKSFKLQGVKISDLVIKEIFRPKHFAENFVQTNIAPIKKRMFALFNILKFGLIIDNKSKVEADFETYIYKCALLGSMSSLFTALDDNPVFSNILNDTFKRNFRNMVYHFGRTIWASESVNSLKLVFMHFYEHCRKELVNYYKFPSLADLINEADRFKDQPNDIKRIVITRCLNSLDWAMFEHNDTIIEQLEKDKKSLLEMIAYFNKYPTLHSVGRFPEATAIAIRGNAIGLLLARLSGGAMCILKERTLDKIVAKLEQVKFVELTVEQKQHIKREYTEYVQPGSAFRHNRLLYAQLPQRFKVRIEKVSDNNQPKPQTTIPIVQLQQQPKIHEQKKSAVVASLATHGFISNNQKPAKAAAANKKITNAVLPNSNLASPSPHP